MAELESGLVHRLREVGGRVSAVEVSAGSCVLELTGPVRLPYWLTVARLTCTRGCSGRARTMPAKGQVVLAQVGDPANVRAATYRIWVRTSFARYLVAWLRAAATGYLA